MKARNKERKGKFAVGRPSSRDEAVLSAGGNRSESVLFDFSNDGGATGDISFERNLPEGAIVKKIISDEQTALTSGGLATLQLKCGSTDLTDALAFDTDFSGVEEQALASSATAIKISAESELKLTIAGAAVTAGKVRFFVEYAEPND